MVTTKRVHAAVIVAMLSLSLAWSWSWKINDVDPSSHRIALTLFSIGLSFAVMWAMLVAARISPETRSRASLWAILPWNSVLLSQLPYIGYMFIPIEILVSALLLRWRAPLSYLRALFFAALARAVVFALIALAASVTRTWNHP